MLILFETAVGYAIFQVLDEKRINKIEKLRSYFEDVNKVNKILQLKHFSKFENIDDAIDYATSSASGQPSKCLKKLLKEMFNEDNKGEVLGVADKNLAAYLKKNLAVSSSSSDVVQELMTCIRSKMDSLIPEFRPEHQKSMELGIAHGISRYQIQFSPEKVDTYIVQAICLFDALDKEYNNYLMRLKEWYGWHFPELTKIVTDSNAYLEVVAKLGLRSNADEIDFEDFLPEGIANQVAQAAQVSIGCDISEEDMMNIQLLVQNITGLRTYRLELIDFLNSRMNAVAPNLTALTGDMVGARLISHAGSLINLAKHPASTIQIIGAEKALFRALKQRSATPKYGHIYHTSLIGKSNPSLKGKVARMLATKAALSARVDALGDGQETEIGNNFRTVLEARINQLESGHQKKRVSGKSPAKFDKFIHQSKFVKKDTIGIFGDEPSGSGQKKKKEKKKKKKEKQREEAMQEAEEDADQEEMEAEGIKEESDDD